MDEKLARSQILLGSMPPREVQNLPITFHVDEANTAGPQAWLKQSELTVLPNKPASK
jgi:hypothetical protein